MTANQTDMAYNLADKPGTEISKIRTPEDMADVAKGELIAYHEFDLALSGKMNAVNEAINKLGFTPYHWKLFCLGGLGYAVDSLLALIMSIAAGQVTLEFQPSYRRGGQIALYAGLLVGAIFWGLTADAIGRKWAFNLSLIFSSVFAIACGGAPDYVGWCCLVALSGFGVGGNLVLDSTVFLEFLPANKQWMVTLMALWWGIGQLLAGLLAWAYIPNFICSSTETCTRANNMGWRYLYFISGAFVFCVSIARVTVVRLRETPKYLICKGRDAEVVELFHSLSTKYNKGCSLTLEGLRHHGTVLQSDCHPLSLRSVAGHYRGLFATRKLGYSTVLIWLSWTLIGLAYALFYVFLPEYLASRGAKFGQTSVSITWRNYVLAQFSAIPGPIVAAALCKNRYLGRKYTMVIGALLSMAFFFAYTAIRSDAENLAFNCVVSFSINIYYGTLYAYSPEVMPSAHRATGSATAVAFNRIMGIVAAIIASYANTATSAPIYVCAGAFVAIAAVAVLLPYEPEGSQSG